MHGFMFGPPPAPMHMSQRIGLVSSVDVELLKALQQENANIIGLEVKPTKTIGVYISYSECIITAGLGCQHDIDWFLFLFKQERIKREAAIGVVKVRSGNPFAITPFKAPAPEPEQLETDEAKVKYQPRMPLSWHARQYYGEGEYPLF